MAFNATSRSLKDTFTVQLRDPATEDLLWADEAQSQPVTVTVFGSASKQYRNAMNALVRKQNDRKGKPAAPSVAIEEGIEFLAACSASSENLEVDGEDVQTLGAFKALYARQDLNWIKKQVDTAISDDANFLDK